MQVAETVPRIACGTIGTDAARYRYIGQAVPAGPAQHAGLLDLARRRSRYGDGRRSRVDDQALDPLLNDVEHGLRDEAQFLDPHELTAFKPPPAQRRAHGSVHA